ncbi:glycosyltransferase 87 family protein [Actinokineospora enzanensis]|uniref:glycosyltransferase 87 family protein n=1 Tax=Actinokineospora enzanensis TaxID=155975 RepID=UPI0003616A9E|nr:glycosyltransferase 87 family protein [Actinokineospora enzanensis]
MSAQVQSDIESPPARPERVLPGSVGWLVLGGLALLAAITGFHAWFDMWTRYADSGLGDFKSYVATGQAVLDGQALYDPSKANLPMLGHTFKYTPFAAGLFVTLAVLPAKILPALVQFSNIALMLVVIWFGWRSLGYRKDAGTVAMTALLGAVSLAMQPVQWNMVWGNVNMLLMAMAIVDVCLPDRNRFKGVLLGLAAGIKLVPGIFILYLLLTKRWRAAITAIVTFLVTIGLGFLVLPGEARYFWLSGVTDPDRVTGAGGTELPENQSIRGAVARLLDVTDPTNAQWMPAAVVIGLVGLVVAVLASRRGQEYLGVSVVGVTMVLVTPLAWSHYWVWFVPFLVLGVHWALSARRVLPWVLIVIAYALVLPWPADHKFDLPEPGLIFLDTGHPWLSEVLSSLSVIIGVILLAAATVAVFRTRRPAPVVHTEPTDPEQTTIIERIS